MINTWSTNLRHLHNSNTLWAAEVRTVKYDVIFGKTDKKTGYF